jgi:pilus assembly protein CpaF
MEGEVITMQELFVFERQGLNPDGSVKGEFRPTGIRPKFADNLKARGIPMPGGLFFDGPRAVGGDDDAPADSVAKGW